MTHTPSALRLRTAGTRVLQAPAFERRQAVAMLRYGSPPNQAANSLRNLAREAKNLVGLAHPEGEQGVFNYRDGYLQWADVAEDVLSSSFIDDITLGLHTPRYWHIHQLNGASARPHAVIGNEISFQANRLEAMARDLEDRVDGLAADGHLVVPDTNVFLHFHTFDRPDWLDLLTDRPLRLVLPYRVIRELDDKKASRRRDLARRSHRVLNHLESLLAPTAGAAAELSSGVTLEVFYERSSGVTNADEEILETCLTLRSYTGRAVTVLSGDTSLRLRAMSLGLPTLTMPDHLRREPVEPEEDH